MIKKVKNHLIRCSPKFLFASYQIRSPLNLQLFRSSQSLQIVRQSLKARYRNQKLGNHISQLLQKHKKNLYELQQINKSINSLQREVKDFKKNKKSSQNSTVNVQKLIQQMSNLKKEQKNMENYVKEIVKDIQDSIMRVGNIVSKQVKVAKDENENQVIEEHIDKSNDIGKTEQKKMSYSEIMQDFGMTDLKRGQKVGGHRGYFLTGNGVKLALGLISYAIDFLEEYGYHLYQSPAIIAEQTLRASCQLQTIQEDVYQLSGLQSYLIATSQQSLAGFYKDQTLNRSQLPIRMGGYSTCFRKQAGAHGKDIHGLFRVHQFEKIQQFTIVQEEKSWQQMNRMMNVSKQFYKSLGLSFRVVNIVSGELNDAASQKLDLEAWYPSQQRYRQLVSVSNCTDYQSRLLKVQYMGDQNQLRYPHMLNGTLIAVQRAMTCLVQNYFRGSYIQVPNNLKKYIGKDRFERTK